MKTNGSQIIPTMRYKDAPKAIDWLCKAFGFEQKGKHLHESRRCLLCEFYSVIFPFLRLENEDLIRANRESNP